MKELMMEWFDTMMDGYRVYNIKDLTLKEYLEVSFHDFKHRFDDESLHDVFMELLETIED